MLEKSPNIYLFSSTSSTIVTMGQHHLLLFLSIYLQIAYPATAAAKCRPQDKSAMLAFRATLSDDPSLSDCVLYDWHLSGDDCCTWKGVKCQPSTGTVLGINIQRSCYQGDASSFSSNSSLFRITTLRTLNLRRLDLHRSAIPNEIGKLTQLRTLDVGEANLKGPIPDAVGNLTMLQELDLETNGLTGSIPVSLAKLRHLQSLALASNKLSGSIPGAFAGLRKLSWLALQKNSLTGSLPAFLFNNPRLIALDLSSNRLSGPFPSVVPGSSNFTRLVLSNNTLVGKIPSWLFEIPYLQLLDLSHNSLGPLEAFRKPATTSLEELDLSFNDLNGPLPSSLLQVAGITSLNLEATQLTGVVEWNSFKYMVNLTILILSLNRGLTLKNTNGAPINIPFFRLLDVRSCSLTEFPNFLSSYNDFQYLDVSYNRISGPVFKNGGWAQLGVFNGSHNQISSFEFPNERIYWFDLSYNAITGPLPEPTPSLEIISLVNNQISGGIATLYCNLSKLAILDLSYNNLDGVLPSCLMNFSGEMSALNLRNNRFNGVIPDAFEELDNNLKFLMFGNNNFEGPLPKSLIACKNLIALDVGNNQITDTFPSYLAHIGSLQILILSSNRFHGSIGAPTSKDHFSNIQILDASSNNFNGPFPVDLFQNLKYMMNVPATATDFVGSGGAIWSDNYYRFLISIDVTVRGVKLTRYNVLNTLTILDLSNNQFSEQIPAIIGNLKALRVLTLSKNQLSGLIPSSIGNMSDLESLDLSRNKFGGRIPSSVTKLKNLEFLNLSYNDLQGPIPPGKFPSSSYVGNPGLCGPPLSKPC